MANCLNWIAAICFFGSIILGAVMKDNEENKKVVAYLILGGFAITFILGLFLIPQAEYSDAQENALVCLHKQFGEHTVIKLSQPVCSSSSRYTCKTWEANFTSGEHTGSVKFDIDSCVINP